MSFKSTAYEWIAQTISADVNGNTVSFDELPEKSKDIIKKWLIKFEQKIKQITMRSE